MNATTTPSLRNEGLSVFKLVGIVFLVYLLTCYGGIRSPDGEVVYRTGEALALEGRWAVAHQLEIWKGFGVAAGTDGRWYSIFGPLQSVLIAPFVRVAAFLDGTGWYEWLPWQFPRNYFGDFSEPGRPETKTNRALAARRLLASLNVPLVSALVCGVFALLVFRMEGSAWAAWGAALLLAFASPLWPYAGACFSEPLAMLFLLLALVPLFPSRRSGAFSPTGDAGAFRIVASGFSLGLATLSHITAILFLPFFLLYLAFSRFPEEGMTGDAGGNDGSLALRETAVSRRPPWLQAPTSRVLRVGPAGPCSSAAIASRGKLILAFVAGIAIPLVFLGWYNFARFGSVFETGRSVPSMSNAILSYGVFEWNPINIYGLLFSASKGLFFFFPMALLGCLFAGEFRRRHPVFFWAFGSAILFRILFIACRSDWHGGFCLGPRYLLLAVPFFLLPIGTALARWERLQKPPGTMVAVAVGGCLAASQQWYFCLGEFYVFFVALKEYFRRSGIVITKAMQAFDDWSVTPLFGFLETRRAPFLLSGNPLSSEAIWALGTLGLGLATVLCVMPFLHGRGRARSSQENV